MKSLGVILMILMPLALAWADSVPHDADFWSQNDPQKDGFAACELTLIRSSVFEYFPKNYTVDNRIEGIEIQIPKNTELSFSQVTQLLGLPVVQQYEQQNVITRLLFSLDTLMPALLEVVGQSEGVGKPYFYQYRKYGLNLSHLSTLFIENKEFILGGHYLNNFLSQRNFDFDPKGRGILSPLSTIGSDRALYIMVSQTEGTRDLWLWYAHESARTLFRRKGLKRLDVFDSHFINNSINQYGSYDRLLTTLADFSLYPRKMVMVNWNPDMRLKFDIDGVFRR